MLVTGFYNEANGDWQSHVCTVSHSEHKRTTGEIVNVRRVINLLIAPVLFAYRKQFIY